MNPEILPLLSCPCCPGTDLSLKDAQFENERVFSGKLRCARCNQTYPITHGIPRFVSSEKQQTESVQEQIAKNFGEAWKIYAQERSNPYTETQFLDWIIPLQSSDFSEKIVLDLGCGLAGFAEYAATYGPRHIIGMDISCAVDSAVSLLAQHPNLSLIQGDILNPPFKPEVFDLVYSIGVLHHLENPEQGFLRTIPQVKAGGRIFAWLYGRENNGLVVHIIDPLRKILNRLPVSWVRYGFALPISIALWPWLHTVYHPKLNRIFGFLPYSAYFYWLRKYGFFYVWGMITDQLIPPRTFYFSKEDLEGWLQRAKLELVSITPRNQISWRVLGEKASSLDTH